MAGNNRRRGKGYTPRVSKVLVNYRTPHERKPGGVATGEFKAVSIKPSGSRLAARGSRLAARGSRLAARGSRHVTQHHTAEMAAKRLAGNRRHTGHQLIRPVEA